MTTPAHNSRYWIIISISAILLLLPLNHLWADDGYLWDFNREEGLKGWSGQRGRFAFFKQEGIVKIDAVEGETVFVSPDGLNLSADKSHFLKIRMRIASQADSMVFILFRPKGAERFFYDPRLSFTIEPQKGFRDCRVNLAEFAMRGMILDQFAIQVASANTVEIDSVEIYEPSFIELYFNRLKQGFLSEEVIRGVTINTVTTPMIGRTTFPVFLYGIAVIISIGILLFRKRFTINDISKAVIISFICIGIIFTLRMDYNWLRIFKKDIKTLSGKKVEERIAMLEGADLYNFISLAKTIIPPDKKARRITESADDYFAVKGKYYLMPIKTSKDGDYIVVYMDKTVAFDPITRTLSKDRKVIAQPAEMIYNYNNYGFIYRIIK